MTVQYHIRTLRGTSVFIVENLERAKQERLAAEKRVGCKMQLIRVTQHEEIVE
tara:strand:- start:1857 stop:2015 length:159 start_codon:yes stop_codon:yes gene_type:complete